MAKLLYNQYKSYDSGYLKVDDIHTIYYEEFGSPEGIPIVFFHGGPGAGFSSNITQFFDPSAFRLIAFDQRGAGQSKPYAEIKNNTPDLLVEDVEKLRKHLGIHSWHVYGGSWGSTLGLLYAEEHPDRVKSMTLSGIFTMRRQEIDWFAHKMGTYFPDAQDEFEQHIPKKERKNLLSSYFNRLTDPDPDIHLSAAHAWEKHEQKCVSLKRFTRAGNPQKKKSSSPTAQDRSSLAISRIECHYMLNNRFDPDDRILANVDKIRHIPTVILQGQYDVICPPKTAVDLKKAFPEAHLEMILMGHGPHDTATAAYRTQATNRIRDYGSPVPRAP